MVVALRALNKPQNMEPSSKRAPNEDGGHKKQLPSSPEAFSEDEMPDQPPIGVEGDVGHDDR
jgi:hypothetical protein